MREPDISAGRGGLASVAAQYYQGASANIQAGMQNLQNAHDSIINRYKRQREQESHNKQMDYYDAQIRSTDAQTEHTQNRTRIENEKLPHEINAMKAQTASNHAHAKNTNFNTNVAIQDQYNMLVRSGELTQAEDFAIANGLTNKKNAKNYVQTSYARLNQNANTNQQTMASNQTTQPTTNNNAQASNNLNDMQNTQKPIDFTKQNDNTNNNKVASAADDPTLPMNK